MAYVGAGQLALCKTLRQTDRGATGRHPRAGEQMSIKFESGSGVCDGRQIPSGWRAVLTDCYPAPVEAHAYAAAMAWAPVRRGKALVGILGAACSTPRRVDAAERGAYLRRCSAAVSR